MNIEIEEETAIFSGVWLPVVFIGLCAGYIFAMLKIGFEIAHNRIYSTD